VLNLLMRVGMRALRCVPLLLCMDEMSAVLDVGVPTCRLSRARTYESHSLWIGDVTEPLVSECGGSHA
jgi:hypothetical protein